MGSKVKGRGVRSRKRFLASPKSSPKERTLRKRNSLSFGEGWVRPKLIY
jgi:hypothetical protein